MASALYLYPRIQGILARSGDDLGFYINFQERAALTSTLQNRQHETELFSKRHPLTVSSQPGSQQFICETEINFQ